MIRFSKSYLFNKNKFLITI